MISGLLQLPHELGVIKFSSYIYPLKGPKSKRRSRTPYLCLSSSYSHHDAWNHHASRQIYKPVHCISRRCNLLVCQAFPLPNSAGALCLLKSQVLYLTRSLFVLKRTPTILLVTAVGTIGFALWGLVPLVRSARKLLLHQNDSTWERSNAQYIFASYVRPLLLLAGAALFCSSLDPVVLHSEASQVVKQRLLNFVKSLAAVLTFAYCLRCFIQQAQKLFTKKSDGRDPRNVGDFTGKAIYTCVGVIAVALFMELLGFPTKKWITAGGLGTVLLTLAGREIFTNFLSGVIIQATRPFVANEWIQTKIDGYEVSGTVERVGWWSPTIIRGDDREAIHIPNHKFTVTVVRNLSQKTHWRIKTHLAISHLDASKINNIVADMRKVISKNPQVEQQRLHRRVFLDNINPENQALLILVSCFVKTSHFEEYLCVKEAVLLDLLTVISHHRARLATPIRTVQKMYGDTNLENIPFAETIFTHAGTAEDRPYLLLEPSIRINGEDKAKSRPTARVSEEPAIEGTVLQNIPDKQQLSNTNPTEERSKIGKSSIDPSKAQMEVLDSQRSNTKASSEKRDQSEGASPSTTKHRQSFEDNIVLGVALEGSKRTLPIEEGMVGPEAGHQEANAMSAARNVDKKESKSGTSTKGGQKEQDR